MTPADIRDLISEAINDSTASGEGADFVLNALADAGLMIAPDLSQVCADYGLNCASLSYHVSAGFPAGWTSALHRGKVVLCGKGAFDADPHAALAASLEAEPFDTGRAVA